MIRDILSVRAHILFGLVLSGLIAWTTVDLLDTEPPYSYDVARSYVVPSTAAEGQQITVRWKVRLSRRCPGINRRVLFDPITKVVLVNYDATPVTDGDDVDQTGYISRTFLLPRGGVLPPGKIGYRNRSTYWCNLLQHVWPLVIQTPDLFFVVEAEK